MSATQQKAKRRFLGPRRGYEMFKYITWQEVLWITAIGLVGCTSGPENEPRPTIRKECKLVTVPNRQVLLSWNQVYFCKLETVKSKKETCYMSGNKASYAVTCDFYNDLENEQPK